LEFTGDLDRLGRAGVVYRARPSDVRCVTHSLSRENRKYIVLDLFNSRLRRFSAIDTTTLYPEQCGNNSR
jgi:hypothetical protein